MLIATTIYFLEQIISLFAHGVYYSALFEIILTAIYIYIMFHIAYVEIKVYPYYVDIRMGPQKCIIFAWFASSRINKEDIHLIVEKKRQCIGPDICCRFYCSPVFWCCCHKSYSAWWFPCPIWDLLGLGWQVNILYCCNNEYPTNDMIQFNLSENEYDFTALCGKKCAPCPIGISFLWCCVYNRISVSVRQEYKNEILQELITNGYPVGAPLESQTGDVEGSDNDNNKKSKMAFGFMAKDKKEKDELTQRLVTSGDDTGITAPGMSIMIDENENTNMNEGNNTQKKANGEDYQPPQIDNNK